MALGQGREGDAPLVAVIAALAAILGGMVSGNYAVLGVTATIDSAH